MIQGYNNQMGYLPNFQVSTFNAPYGQNAMLNGKLVESKEMVRNIDIPMTGQNYYFPRADGTEIYVKRWLQNGTTEILSYKPALEQQMTISTTSTENVKIEQNNGFEKAIEEHIRSLEERIDKLEKKNSGKKKEDEQ